MVSINPVWANICMSFLLIVLSICAEPMGVCAFSDEETIHYHSTENDFDPPDPEPKRVTNSRHNKLLRFLGDTPSTIFINTLSVVSSIFTIWGFIETRDDMIEMKKMKKMKEEEETNESDQTELIEELNQKLDGLHSGIREELGNLKNSLKQLSCRFDAVHAKSKSISKECLKFIRPIKKPILNNAVTIEAKHPQQYKSNYVEKRNSYQSTYVPNVEQQVKR